VDILQRVQIAGASKRKNGNPGYADIVAYDSANDQWYISEVKKVGGVNGEAGAESTGPSDLAWYMAKFRAEHPGAKIKPGIYISRELMQPDPLDRRQTLVAQSSTTLGRPSPKFDGVVGYWTRKQRDTDENTREIDERQQASADAAKNSSAVDPPSPVRVGPQPDWPEFPLVPEIPILPGIPVPVP
jgi:hypothetical protein